MKKTILIILFLFSICLNANAATYYVSAAGNDTTGDGSIGNPWRQCFKAYSSISAGDTVLFNRGDTFGSTCIIPADNVTYDAYGTGNKPIIDQTNSRANCISSTAKTGAVIQNIECKNSTSDGFLVDTSGSATFTNLVVHDTGNDGFKVKGTASLTFSNLVAYNNNTSSVADGFSLHDTSTATGSVFEAYNNGNGISNEKGTTFTCTSGCYMHGNLYHQVDAADSGSGTSATINIYNSLIVGGVGTQYGIADKVAPARGDYTLKNVIITGVPSGYYALSVTSVNSTITAYHVTIDSNDGGLNMPSSQAGAITLTDVVFSNSTSGKYITFGNSGSVGNTFMTNVAFDKPLASLSDQTTQLNTTYGSKTNMFYNVSPGYSSITNTDYHLTLSSDLIDRGIAISGMTTDYDGSSYVGYPDIGAFEFPSQINRISNGNISS